MELIVSFTIMLVLSTMALPLARYKIRRDREIALREALKEMRTAIDKYKDDADSGKLGPTKLDTYGYPESLDVLVEGVKMSGTVDVKKRYLRRLPAGSVHQHARVGQAQHAGRPDLLKLGRAKRFRRLYDDD